MKTWPEDNDEREAYAHWQTEVAAADTVLGFRDWLAHRAEVIHQGTMIGDRITCTCGYVTAAYPTSDERHGEFNDHLAEVTA